MIDREAGIGMEGERVRGKGRDRGKGGKSGRQKVERDAGIANRRSCRGR